MKNEAPSQKKECLGGDLEYENVVFGKTMVVEDKCGRNSPFPEYGAPKIEYLQKSLFYEKKCTF